MPVVSGVSGTETTMKSAMPQKLGSSLEREGAVDEIGDPNGAAVGDGDLHLERLGAASDRFADMAEAEEADGLAGHLVVNAVGRARPIGPVALPQAAIGFDERNMPGEQRGHHVFGDRLLVAEAVADDRRERQRVEIDAVVSGAREHGRASGLRVAAGLRRTSFRR